VPLHTLAALPAPSHAAPSASPDAPTADATAPCHCTMFSLAVILPSEESCALQPPVREPTSASAFAIRHSQRCVPACPAAHRQQLCVAPPLLVVLGSGQTSSTPPLTFLPPSANLKTLKDRLSPAPPSPATRISRACYHRCTPVTWPITCGQVQPSSVPSSTATAHGLRPHRPPPLYAALPPHCRSRSACLLFSPTLPACHRLFSSSRSGVAHPPLRTPPTPHLWLQPRMSTGARL